MSSRLLNLPNILTLARIGAVPIMVVLLLSDTPAAGIWAAAVFGLASITDWLDGYLARRWEIVTILGKFLDPLADKLLVMAALIMFIPLGRITSYNVCYTKLLRRAARKNTFAYRLTLPAGRIYKICTGFGGN